MRTGYSGYQAWEQKHTKGRMINQCKTNKMEKSVFSWDNGDKGIY